MGHDTKVGPTASQCDRCRMGRDTKVGPTASQCDGVQNGTRYTGRPHGESV